MQAFSASRTTRWLPQQLAKIACCCMSSSENFISIDRSGLFRTHKPPDGAPVPKDEETEMTRHIKSLVRFRGGPITLAEYMSEVLTNATAGYYTQRDVFGAAGDFITSPEISQMFGEMMGIWCVAAWQQLGSPSCLRIVELGPGRGTLMADLLRGTAAFPQFRQSVTVSLVEVSPVLRQLQLKTLGCPTPPQSDCSEAIEGPMESATADGVLVSWHRSLDGVPEGEGAPPTLYLAHEFLDALPVHQFQRANRMWSERLVDEAPPEHPRHLRMVLSPGPTPAAAALLPMRLEALQPEQRAQLYAIEVCPQGMALAESLARRVVAHGGAALLIDYGRDAPYRGSLQAIKDHTFVDIFESPGAADLSAWVDFDALRLGVRRSGAAAAMHGPISQRQLLQGLGIEARLEQLVKCTTDEAQAEALVEGYMRLVGGAEEAEEEGAVEKKRGPKIEGMGENYQAVCIAPVSAPPPVPFA